MNGTGRRPRKNKANWGRSVTFEVSSVKKGEAGDGAGNANLPIGPPSAKETLRRAAFPGRALSDLELTLGLTHRDPPVHYGASYGRME